MHEFGRWIFVLGLIITLMGLVFWIGGSRLSWFGRLPGDISYSKGNFTFYFPLATCLLLSAILTLVFWFLSKK